MLATSNELRSIVAESPAAKLELVVEQQVPRRLAVLHRQGSESLMFIMKLHHAPEIDGTEDIDVVHDEGFLPAESGRLESPAKK
jgi:hypothetical protein